MEGSNEARSLGGAGNGIDEDTSLFEELLAREYTDFRFSQFHRLTVDCYALQNPEKHMKTGKAYAAHLIGVYLAVETKDPDRLNGAVQTWLSRNPTIEIPGYPAKGYRGEIDLTELLALADPGVYSLRLQEWAQSVWSNWSDYHPFATQWLKEAGIQVN